MADRTPQLDLLRQYLEDFADERARNINWDIIDKLFHPTEGHKHDGVDSPLIDLDSLWRAIYELRALLAQLRIDLNNLDLRDYLQHQEYLRHKHYELDAPPSQETSWFETFNSLGQLDMINSTVSVSPQQGRIHLPAAYQSNTSYFLVSKPFKLLHTLASLTARGLQDQFDPDVQPQQATARIFMARKGIVTPYLAISDNLIPSRNNAHIYPNAVAGNQREVSFVDEFITSKYGFQGKRTEDFAIPHVAYHHIDDERPEMSRYKWGRGKDNDRWQDRVEFSNIDYETISTSDGKEVATTPRYQDSDPIYKRVESNINPRVLYHADRALSWDKRQNKFYWYIAEKNVFKEIPPQEIAPLTESRMIKVAAGIDKTTGEVVVMKTWNVKLDRPKGYFDQMHQIVRWDTFTGFEEGPIWKSGRHRAKHWPAKTISPSHIEVDANNIHLFTQLSFNGDLAQEGEDSINYYEKDPNTTDFDSYPWLPFRKVYGDLHQKRKTVNFAEFNPGMVGTVLSINKAGTLVPQGPAKIITGFLDPTINPWAATTDEFINQFEGGNDSVYLGSNGEEMFFYQAFVPYNGADIHTNQLWKNPTFRENNPDDAWNGIVAHNIANGTNRLIRGNIPFRVNVGGGIEEEGGYAMLNGGTELVKQFVTSDERIIATENNQTPENEEIIYSYWVDRHITGVVTADRLSVRDDIVNPIRVDLFTGESERVMSYTDDTSLIGVEARTQSPQIVMHRTGFSSIGGKQITRRQAKRIRRSDPPVRRIVGWTGAILSNSKARQLYHFRLGEGLGERDIVKVHFKARSEGKPAANPVAPTGGALKERDFEVYSWAFPEWTLLGRVSNGDGDMSFQIPDTEWISTRNLGIMIESSRASDRRAKIGSKLFVDYCYITVERQGYIYEYEWDDIPDGTDAAIVLDCQTGARFTDVLEDEQAEGSLVDLYGVEVESIDVSIISNREG
jgi:hypothetical protein